MTGFSGPIDTLRIVVLNARPAGGGTLALDNLVLTQTPSAVPEPSTLTLLGIGSLGLLGYGWKRRKQAAV